jgi:hypothetical protein
MFPAGAMRLEGGGSGLQASCQAQSACGVHRLACALAPYKAQQETCPGRSRPHKEATRSRLYSLTKAGRHTPKNFIADSVSRVRER